MMNPRAVRNSIFALITLSLAGALHAAELTVRVIDPPESGTLVFVLFDSPDSFGDLRDPAKVVRLPIGDRGSYRIEDVPPGEYALLVYLDENGNGRLDKNFIGIPKEPLGFSNRYQPKGPPTYSRAAFTLVEDGSIEFDVDLYLPLGRRGRIGAGLGIIARSSPYRNYDGDVVQAIPAITYSGEKLQVFGPVMRYGLAGSGRLRLAASGQLRIGVYEEDKSDLLTGMGNRKTTFLGGLSLQAELPRGIELFASYEHDLLDRIGGGSARVAIEKSFQLGVLRISPELATIWTGTELSNHDFGVPVDKATATRQAYALDDTFSIEGGFGLLIEVTRGWVIAMNLSAELLCDDVTDSPLVDQDRIFKGFLAVNYVF